MIELSWILVIVAFLLAIPADRSGGYGGCRNGCNNSACYMTHDCGGFKDEGE